MANFINDTKIKSINLLGVLIMCGACYGAGEIRHLWWPGTLIVIVAGLSFGYGMLRAGK